MPTPTNIGMNPLYLIVDETTVGTADITIDQTDSATSQGKANIGVVRLVPVNVDSIPATVGDSVLFKTERVIHFLQNGARFTAVLATDVILWNVIPAAP